MYNIRNKFRAILLYVSIRVTFVHTLPFFVDVVSLYKYSRCFARSLNFIFTQGFVVRKIWRFLSQLRIGWFTTRFRNTCNNFMRAMINSLE
ncbi:hypothetical protein PUN28_009135 [Cardiocondyla obscurior]|uniref:Secreted protein n=1 Tax=Cardiocondyla obscurior TaxID=286306 RepID=A0AAW2FTY6_9HYME